MRDRRQVGSLRGLCVLCCIAVSDEQPHMASPLRALLMLEAPVWAGAAAGSVCQRIRDRQGGGRAAATCPPSDLVKKPQRYVLQTSKSLSYKLTSIFGKLRRVFDVIFFRVCLQKYWTRNTPWHTLTHTHTHPGLPACLRQKHTRPCSSQIGQKDREMCMTSGLDLPTILYTFSSISL